MPSTPGVFCICAQLKDFIAVDPFTAIHHFPEVMEHEFAFSALTQEEEKELLRDLCPWPASILLMVYVLHAVCKSRVNVFKAELKV